MFLPWTLEERAAKWFPLLGDKRIKRGLQLMQKFFPLPEDWSTVNHEYGRQQVHRISAILNIPPDIREHVHQSYKFLLVLQKLMLEKKQFEELHLGMPVMIYDQVGTIVRLNRKKFCAVVRLRDFYDALETVSVTEVCPLHTRRGP